MKRVVIDRLDGIYAICSDDDKKYYAIAISELPENAAVGSVLDVDDEAGVLTAEDKKAKK